MSSLTLLLKCIREVRQTNRDLKQIENIDTSIDALQRLIDTVAFGQDVEIEVKLKTGGSLTIRRKTPTPTFTTFQDRVHQAKLQRGE